ncbi:MAG TPA: nickel pincer cofactor biosynthesis protein LarC [Polyangiaceae bacterium]
MRARRVRSAGTKKKGKKEQGSKGSGHHGHHGRAHSHGPGVPLHVHAPESAGGRSKMPPREALADLAAEAQAHREALPEGAGAGKTLFLDAASGIAGDMTIAALVDLGVPLSVVERAVAALPLRGVALRLESVHAGAIGATEFEVLVPEGQPERTYRDIDRMIEKASLSGGVKDLSRAIFRRLGEAEAEVHRIPLADVHFHEVGAVDAIVDIVGAAACFAHLGAEVVGSPLPLGRGFVTCRHGVIPLPAPATVACLKGVPTVDARIEAELVTPTGAAIVATVARRFEAWPAMAPERIGWGAGTAMLPGRPNALRVVLGPRATAEIASSEAVGTHVVVEANLDDATGELVGHAIAMLLAAGALDAWATPTTMKKGRPGIVLSALTNRADASRIAEVVLRETSSIGVRYAPVSRLERPREIHTVSTRFGNIPVKVSGGPYGAPIVKPEFDACVEAAARTNVAVRVVIAEAVRVAELFPALMETRTRRAEVKGPRPARRNRTR